MWCPFMHAKEHHGCIRHGCIRTWLIQECLLRKCRIQGCLIQEYLILECLNQEWLQEAWHGWGMGLREITSGSSGSWDCSDGFGQGWAWECPGAGSSMRHLACLNHWCRSMPMGAVQPWQVTVEPSKEVYLPSLWCNDSMSMTCTTDLLGRRTQLVHLVCIFHYRFRMPSPTGRMCFCLKYDGDAAHAHAHRDAVCGRISAHRGCLHKEEAQLG